MAVFVAYLGIIGIALPSTIIGKRRRLEGRPQREPPGPLRP